MRKILAIDDNADNLVVYKAILRPKYSGCDILTSQSAQEGIQLAEINQPDVIILDIIMPGLDGFSACKQLKSNQLTKHIPIILITAIRGDNKSRIKGLEIGADAFLSKPIEENELIAQINVMLRIKDAEDELREKNKDLEVDVKQKISELETSQRTLNNLLNNLPGFAYQCLNNRDWSMTYISDGCKEITGYSPDVFISKKAITFNDIIHLDHRERLWDKWQKTLSQKSTFQAEYPIIDAKGETKWIWEQGSGVFQNDNLLYIEGFITDISERKELTQSLIKAKDIAEESDRLKSVFLATMSHELRTPLNAVIGFSDLIQQDLPLEDILHFSEIISMSGKHLLGVIEDVFDISLIETGDIKIEVEPLSTTTLLSEVHEIIKNEQILQEKEHLELILENSLETSGVILFSDQKRIKQILINLLKNALKFTNKGSVNFGCFLHEEEQQQFIKFFVKDSGIGIPQKAQKLIFEVFRQADDSHTRIYGGTGLGLTICKKLTKLMGGNIWVESEEGQGSLFNFTIPFTSESEEYSVTTSLEPTINLANKTVLIAEDDEISFSFLDALLTPKGMTCIRVNDGDEAVAYCQENDKIDLLLMDINMPKMNGILATEQIKKIRPDIPIIAQTAFAIEGDREKILASGCDYYISKPINKLDLLNKINQCLEKQNILD